MAGGAGRRLPEIGGTLAGEKLPKLVDLMAHLRGPEGCPWDREQDYDTLKGLLLEEAYEVIDAINARDFHGLEDELGDLLFQVVFYSRLAQEEGRFDIDNVIERVHAKLIRRHPHVFGAVHARNADEALDSWLRVKEQERGSAAHGKDDRKSLLDGIAPACRRPSKPMNWDCGRPKSVLIGKKSRTCCKRLKRRFENYAAN